MILIFIHFFKLQIVNIDNRNAYTFMYNFNRNR